MDERLCYPIVLRFDAVDRVALWESGGEEPDRIVVDAAGVVLAFPSVTAARESSTVAARAMSDEDAPVYDLDAIAAWCHSDRSVDDCSTLLNAWNLFTDLPHDDLFARADADATAIYDKLFWGCNLPAMTPPGEYFTPTWSSSELAALKHVLLLGLADLRSRLR